LLIACLREAAARAIADVWAGNGLDLAFGGGLSADMFDDQATDFHERFWAYTMPLIERWYGSPDPVNVYGRLGAKHGVRFHLPFETAELIELGVPEPIAYRKKWALQESSGLFDLLVLLAREDVPSLAPDQMSSAYEPESDPHLMLRYYMATIAADATRE
jgi:hypothetical protein